MRRDHETSSAIVAKPGTRRDIPRRGSIDGSQRMGQCTAAARTALALLAAVVAVIFCALIIMLRGATHVPADVTAPNPTAARAVAGSAGDEPRALEKPKPDPQPPTEPGSSPVEGARRAGPTASLRDPGVYLRVRVLAPSGDPLTHGQLSCAHGQVFGDDPQQIERIDSQIQGDTTLLHVPLSSTNAFINAVVEGFRPEQVYVDDLRRTGGHWLKDLEWAQRDVAIHMKAHSPGPWLQGLVRVEGEPQIPKGLCIRAVAVDRADRGSPDSRPRVALLDPAHSSYELDQLSDGDWALEATSQETIPNWTPLLVRPGDTQRIVDLDLSWGTRLRIEVKDANTQAAAPDIQLVARYNMQRATSDTGAKLYRQITLSARTDSNGACTVGPLPSGVEVAICERSDSNRPLRELTIPPGSKEDIHQAVWIHGSDPGDVELFGSLAPDDFPGSGPLVLRVRAGDAKTASSTDVSGDHWSSRCAPALTCHLWMDRGSRRVSEVVTVRAALPRTGPITLVPLKRSQITIHWRNAPTQGSLELVAVDPNHGVPTKTSIALNSSEGARACELFADGGVAVRLVGPSGSVVNWNWAHSELSDPLAVDLGNDRASAVVVYANGDRPTGQSQLTLVPLESNQGAGHCFATLALENGVSTETIPLFSGPIYYRLDAKGSRAAVCGVFRADDARPDHRVTIAWTGTPTALSEFGPAGQGGLELVSWDGNKLDAVAKTLRRFRMSELLGEGQDPLNRTSSVTVNTSHCRFNVFP